MFSRMVDFFSFIYILGATGLHLSIKLILTKILGATDEQLSKITWVRTWL